MCRYTQSYIIHISGYLKIQILSSVLRAQSSHQNPITHWLDEKRLLPHHTPSNTCFNLHILGCPFGPILRQIICSSLHTYTDMWLSAWGNFELRLQNEVNRYNTGIKVMFQQLMLCFFLNINNHNCHILHNHHNYDNQRHREILVKIRQYHPMLTKIYLVTTTILYILLPTNSGLTK